MLETIRNEVISYLLTEGFTTTQQAGYNKDGEYFFIPFFISYNIEVFGRVGEYDLSSTLTDYL